MRKALKYMGLVFGGIIAGMLAGEVIVRAMFPHGHGPYIHDERAFYKLKPGFEGLLISAGKPSHIRINKLGIRGPELSRDAGKPIVLCLGDSFTYGAGVDEDETFTADLNKSSGGKYVAVNAGVVGYNLSQYYSRLASIGGELRPAVVVLGIFANDWEDLGYSAYLVDRGGNLVIAPASMRAADFNAGGIQESWEDAARARRGKTLQWAITNSRLIELVYMRIFYARMARGRGEAGGVAPGSWQRFGVLTRDLLQGRSNPEIERIRASGISLIEAMDAMTKGWGGRFAVMYIPFEDEIGRPELDALHNRLIESLNERGILAIDLLPLFRAEQEPLKLYLAGDGHFSPAGHRAAAGAIRKGLRL